jgi:hypothetical protein
MPRPQGHSIAALFRRAIAVVSLVVLVCVLYTALASSLVELGHEMGLVDDVGI